MLCVAVENEDVTMPFATITGSWEAADRRVATENNGVSEICRTLHGLGSVK